ncbi:MAG: hypothetical protein AAFN78_20255 [Pseudomonadota bacterium]
MKQIPHSHGTIYTTTRPLGILGTVAAAIGLIIAAVFGAVFFVALMGLLLVVGLIVAARVWWTTRELRAEMRRSGTTLNDALRQQAGAQPFGNQAPGGSGAGKQGGQTIEGEFQEVDR